MASTVVLPARARGQRSTRSSDEQEETRVYKSFSKVPMRVLSLVLVACALSCARAPRSPVDNAGGASSNGPPFDAHVAASAPSDATASDASVGRVEERECEPYESPLCNVRSYADPAVFEQLVRNPRFQPDDPSSAPGGSLPLLCGFSLGSQSCVPNECYDNELVPCYQQCQTSCERCTDTCRNTCASCAAACTDDACRRACATRCAGCLDGCLQTRDRCGSGECAQSAEQCEHDRVVSMLERRCGPPCRACFRRCANAERREECMGRCIARNRRCTADEREMCASQAPHVLQESSP